VVTAVVAARWVLNLHRTCCNLSVICFSNSDGCVLKSQKSSFFLFYLSDGEGMGGGMGEGRAGDSGGGGRIGGRERGCGGGGRSGGRVVTAETKIV
jgi:hypothetical protein